MVIVYFVGQSADYIYCLSYITITENKYILVFVYMYVGI